MNVFDRNINFDALFKFSQISRSTQQHLKNVYASLSMCMFVAAAGAYVHVVTRLLQGGLLSVLGSLAMMMWLSMTPHSPETEKKRLAILSAFAFLTGLSILLLVSMVNMFLGSVALFKVHMYLALAIMHCVDLFLDFVTIFRKLMILLAMNEKKEEKEEVNEEQEEEKVSEENEEKKEENEEKEEKKEVNEEQEEEKEELKEEVNEEQEEEKVSEEKKKEKKENEEQEEQIEIE
ncbi:bax inhibitor 1 [Silurus meridionalis]|nr:bax inhibitor 1 [Silurus meridionalis]